MHICPVSGCNYRTPRPANLRRHAVVHEKPATGVNGCSLCPYKTARHNNVLRHQRLVHGGKGAVVKASKRKKIKTQSELRLEPMLQQYTELEPFVCQSADDVIIWPTEEHWEASFYKQAASPNFTIVCKAQSVSDDLNMLEECETDGQLKWSIHIERSY